MELLVILLIVAFVTAFVLHPRTKNHPIARWLRRTIELIIRRVRRDEEDTPEPAAKTVHTSSSEPGNVPRIKSEMGKEPPTKDQHEFPAPREPITRFEEFNAKLFVYEISETRRWDRSLDNDFATRVSGEETWLISEIKRRLRPSHPVLFDPFGLWARASEQLELDPHYEDPIAAAYLSIDRANRPVVVSNANQQIAEQASSKSSDEKPKFVVLYRYGFVDYRFDRKFLEDYPADLVTGLLKALSGPEDGWVSFSPARLRSEVLEENREEEAHRQAMASHQHDNRFAVLWNLRDEEVAEGDIQDTDALEEAAQ